MARTLDELLEALRGGDEKALEPLAALLEAAETGRLVALLTDPHAPVRMAVVRVLVRRDEPAAHEALVRAASDAVANVRIALAAALEGKPGERVDALFRELFDDEDDKVRFVAARSAAGRPALVAALRSRLTEDDDWNVRHAAARALGADTTPETLLALIRAFAEDDDFDVAKVCAKQLETALERADGTLAVAAGVTSALLEAAAERLKDLGATSRHARLTQWIADKRAQDHTGLERFGTDLTSEAERGRLPRAYDVETACDAVLRGLSAAGPRGFVLLGPPGSGKTAVVQELVHRLRDAAGGAWRVLRVNPSEILAGTVYLGEWQTKVKNLIEAVRAPRRVLLYVPNLSELAHVGRASRSDLNVATMLAPHLASGAVALLGESTVEAFRSGLGADPSLRRLFVPIELAAADQADTRAILQAVRDEAGVEMSDSDLDSLQELAGLYVPGTVQPGRAVGLLRRLIETGRGRGPLVLRDVLNTLASSTGIPVDFLDDAVPLDPARVRDFFEARVMGQPEAVASVLDLVTLVKAGMADPNRPYGVLFFIGPTGVGKTELARALAELLFGDAARLLRYDMSEYASPDAYQRLIGREGVPGTLTAAVHEHPFSVVLLDEIEKAHLNAFDLFLQVFDAGRLTDGQGHTIDFRRTIVILTSNLGSAVRTEPPIGFGSVGPGAAAPGGDEILREVHRFFRPEFVNRLDAVVPFRPLGLDTAEQIARREVDRVLRRTGIARRRLTVDVDPSVLTLLLRVGYSPAFGARPLKRTVERLVLLPVAQAVAQGGALPGALLRLVARGDRVVVEVDGPDEAEGAPGATPAVAAGDLPPGGAPARAQALRARAVAAVSNAQPLADRKAALLERSRTTSFWKDQAAARTALDAVHRLERVIEEAARVASMAERLEELAARPAAARRSARLPDRLDELARDLAYAERLVACTGPHDLSDAFVRISRVRAEGEDLAPVERLAAMYEGFAKSRGLEVETLDERRTEEPSEDAVTLLVSGAGAHALLAGEQGIHRLARSRAPAARGGRRPGRAWVRVEVFPVPPDDARVPLAAVRVTTRPVKGKKGRRTANPTMEVRLHHEPSLTSLTAFASGPKEAVVERLLPLLTALVDRSRTAAASGVSIVRGYELGPAARVRDRRTGRATGHLDRVLRGELDLLLATD